MAVHAGSRQTYGAPRAGGPVWEFADRVQITRSVLEAVWKALVVPAPFRRLLRHTLLPLTPTTPSSRRFPLPGRGRPQMDSGGGGISLPAHLVPEPSVILTVPPARIGGPAGSILI